MFFPGYRKISNPKSNPQHLEISSPVLVYHFTRLRLQRLMAVLGQGIHLFFVDNGSLNALFGFCSNLYQQIGPVYLPKKDVTLSTFVMYVFNNVCGVICKYQLGLLSTSLGQNVSGGLDSHRNQWI